MKPPAKLVSAVAAASRPLSPPLGQTSSTADGSRGRAGREPPVPISSRAGRPAVPAAQLTGAPQSQLQSTLQSAAAALHPPANKVSVTIAAISEARCYEVLVPPALMKELGLLPGCSLLTIETEDETITCEVGLSTTLTKTSIGLHPVVAAIMVESHAIIYKRTTPLPPLATVTLKPTSGDAGLEGAREASLEVLTPVQLEALVRRQCQGHVLSASMVVSVRVATQEFRVEVVALQSKQQRDEVRCGFFLPSTEVVVVMTAKEVDDDESGAARPSHAPQVRHDHFRTLLVTGDDGCGKSFRLHQERDALKSSAGIAHTMDVNVAEFLLKNSRGGVSNATALRELFREAQSVAPCIVTFDDLHLLCPATPSPSLGSQWSSAQFASTLASELDRLAGSEMYVLASTPTLEDLAPQVAAYHRLGRHIVAVGPPSSGAERRTVLQHMFTQVLSTGAGDLMDPLAAAIASVAEHSHGCTQRDLSRLKNLAAAEAFQRCGSIDALAPQDILAAAKKLRPSALRNMEVAVPNVSWSDIGGSSAAKAALQDCVDWCLGKNKWIFDAFKLSPPKGVLLYGPPGCSKTMLAKALANESKMNFISIKGPEVFSKWVGDSEKAVRDIFRKARAVAPCVVFVDELDGMCGHRGSGGVSDRVISQFLTELDGLPAAMSEKSNSIILVAATNRPENIDGAVLRPGRIDKKVYVGLPDVEEREAIALLSLRRMPTHPDITAAFVARRTAEYTGAEVVAVCKEAAFHALERDFSANDVTIEDFEAALRKVTPRVSAKEVAWYQQWARGQR